MWGKGGVSKKRKESETSWRKRPRSAKNRCCSIGFERLSNGSRRSCLKTGKRTAERWRGSCANTSHRLSFLGGGCCGNVRAQPVTKPRSRSKVSSENGSVPYEEDYMCHVWAKRGRVRLTSAPVPDESYHIVMEPPPPRPPRRLLFAPRRSLRAGSATFCASVWAACPTAHPPTAPAPRWGASGRGGGGVRRGRARRPCETGQCTLSEVLCLG